MSTIDADPVKWWRVTSRAIQLHQCMPCDIPAGKLISMDHSSVMTLIAVGGNTSQRLTAIDGITMDPLSLVRRAAKDLGYDLRRRSKS